MRASTSPLTMLVTKKLVTPLSLILCAQGLALAQSGSKGMEFEVASVRRAGPASGGAATAGRARPTGRGSTREDPGQVSYRNITLKSLLMRAYSLKPFQISGPWWLDGDRYDVVAKIPEGASRGQVPAMLRNLLAERFRLSLHWESKEERAYVLGVGKSGPKLTPSDEGRDSTGPESGDEPRLPKSISISSAGGITLRGTTMAAFADFLSSDLGRPVIDSTGLQGKFDVFLDVPTGDFLRVQPREAEAPLPETSSLAASIFTAVRGLGLKLDAQKRPIRHLVVDKAEKIPTND